MNLILESFILGLIYGIGPCTMSCAPVLLPIVMSSSKNTLDGLKQSVIFSLGRILVYSLLGMLMGGVGKILNISVPQWVMGAFMIVLGIFLFFNFQKKCLMSKIKFTGTKMAFVAGIMMGLSPCAPLVGALGLSISTKSIILGGLIALSFGFGTLLSPILLVGVVGGKWSSLKEFASVNNYIAGGFLIIIGILMLTGNFFI
jgi:sulfite exporter TauE/SafE